MTLKEKFRMANMVDNGLTILEKYQGIADDYAIDFYNWMRINDTQDNAEKYFHYTDKDMLNVYKEEKGL